MEPQNSHDSLNQKFEKLLDWTPWNETHKNIIKFQENILHDYEIQKKKTESSRLEESNLLNKISNAIDNIFSTETPNDENINQLNTLINLSHTTIKSDLHSEIEKTMNLQEKYLDELRHTIDDLHLCQSKEIDQLNKILSILQTQENHKHQLETSDLEKKLKKEKEDFNQKLEITKIQNAKEHKQKKLQLLKDYQTQFNQIERDRLKLEKRSKILEHEIKQKNLEIVNAKNQQIFQLKKEEQELAYDFQQIELKAEKRYRKLEHISQQREATSQSRINDLENTIRQLNNDITKARQEFDNEIKKYEALLKEKDEKHKTQLQKIEQGYKKRIRNLTHQLNIAGVFISDSIDEVVETKKQNKKLQANHRKTVAENNILKSGLGILLGDNPKKK